MLNEEIEIQQKTIDDTTLSYAERKKALDRQNIATLDLAENTRLMAELEVETLVNAQKLLRDDAAKKEMSQEIAQAKADLIDAETKIAVIQADNNQKSREIDLEEIERKKSIYNTISGLKLESIADEGERIEEEFKISEFKSIKRKNHARYLIYRYKYNKYPELKIVDDYPPCIQIEPSSICNYRCIMCYQIDRSFSNKSTGFMGYMDLF